MKRILTLCLLIITLSSTAQNSFTDTKEKVYVHTSHSFFKPGEQVYFKIYVVKGKDNRPSVIARTAYVDVIAPAGNILKTLTCRVSQGYATGSYIFDAAGKGGVYKLRAYTDIMRNEVDSSWFVKELTVQKIIAPRLMMKLDFKERAYGAGSEMRANLSLRNLDDKAIANHNFEYKIMLGGTEVSTLKSQTDSKGKALISYSLPNSLSSADGLLNVIVKYQGYTESISRAIPLVTTKIDLQFMPEGGTMLANETNNIAFKALKENGKAADFKGVVLDGSGVAVDTIKSFHFGMGEFQLKPKAGEQYSVRILEPSGIKELFKLPIATKSGIALRIIEANNNMRLTARAEIKSIRLQISAHEIISNTIMLKNDGAGNFEYQIASANLPAGINKFSLSDRDGRPLAERLVFVGRTRGMRIEITPSKDVAQRREKMKLEIKTTDDQGHPVPANLSIGVSDDKLWSFADDKSNHINSWLLMSSELHGEVEEPRYYFDSTGSKVDKALDLVMLTNGYRYFRPLPQVKQENRLLFYPSEGHIAGGRVTNARSHGSYVEVLMVVDDQLFRTTSDSLGYFRFNIPGNKYYYFFARHPYKISIMSPDVLKQMIPAKTNEKWQDVSFAAVGEVKPQLLAKDLAMAARFKEIGGMQEMNEVVVTGINHVARRSMTGSVSYVAAADLQWAASPVQALAGKLAGVEILQANGLPGSTVSLRIRGSASVPQPALYVIDGIIRSQKDLENLNPQDITSITVLKNSDATTLYGHMGSNGAVVIETGQRLNSIFLGRKDRLYERVYGYFYEPYEYQTVFYAPQYSTTKSEIRNDFRETIFWNGVVQTDNNGLAKVEYYNSDAQTTFRIVAEGISANGAPGRTEVTYAVQSQLQVDVKIPPYLTIGDRARLPVVIRNNSKREEIINLSVAAPVGFELGSYPQTLTLAAGASRSIFVPISAGREVIGMLTILAESSSEREEMMQSISANQKGFLIVRSVAGDSTGSHQIVMNNPVPGSVKTSLALISDLEGQLTKGIESMLREPHGCFEQTSSSTYPNIYILKYLRSRGNVSASVNQKAMNYLKAGYERLAGFETPASGFEWFGNTPPHEALTAYGLMEFTDMKPFINVNPEMMERTRKFLMDARDGKGGFRKSRDGYDAFRSVPNAVANNYIVWAMSEAGYGKDVVKEYDACFAALQNSTDAYLLSMMALTAHNMQRLADYHFLMNRLSAIGLTAETSVTCSKGVSLTVETTALYALALMKNPEADKVGLAKQISRILSSQNYYGYGSTQATVLALKALVEFSAFNMATSKDVNFIVNNKPMQDLRTFGDMLGSGPNALDVKYAQSGHQVPYYGEISYYTLQPETDRKAEVKMNTSLSTHKTTVGETVRLTTTLTNSKNESQAMVMVKLGIPAGLSAQPWQLKEMMDDKKIAYYEVFDNYLVLYLMGMKSLEEKQINLDLKAEVPGIYTGKAGNTYLYYMPEHKDWVAGETIEIE